MKSVTSPNVVRSPIKILDWISHRELIPSSCLPSLANESIPHRFCNFEGKKESWYHGGLNLVERVGMEEFLESNMGDTHEIPPIKLLFKAADSSLLVSIDSNNYISGFIFGVYPMFCLDFSKFLLSSMNSIRVLPGRYSITDIYLVSTSTTRLSHSPISQQQDDTCNSIVKVPVNNLPCQFCSYKIAEHASRIYLSIQLDLTRLIDMVTSHGRKWKDSCRVVLPKVGLLQGVLEGYQLRLNPVQFMFTVATCGLWHPAAQTSFSQHWNEQGLSRLKSAVDTSANSIVKTLLMRAIPIATNITLGCR